VWRKLHMFTHMVVVDINMLDRALQFLVMRHQVQKWEVLLLEKLVGLELKKEGKLFVYEKTQN
jgi:hypothetical protein